MNDFNLENKTLEAIKNDISAIASSYSLEDLIPQYYYFCELIDEFYANDNAIKNILSTIFGENASSFDGETQYGDLKLLVDFFS